MFKEKNDTVIDGYFMLKKHIIESIKYLATQGEEQLLLLPDFVCKPYEIASSLDDWLLMYKNGLSLKKESLFTESEFKLINDLNDMFKNFYASDEYESSDWTEDAVVHSEKWNKIRKFAKHVLDVLNIEYSMPGKTSV